jgi:hypothetical protein
VPPPLPRNLVAPACRRLAAGFGLVAAVQHLSGKLARRLPTAATADDFGQNRA